MTKEERELMDAISRDKGLAMTPVEELTLLGFYEGNRTAVMGRDNEVFEVELGGEFTALNEIWERINNKPDVPMAKDWNEVEEYEFDNNDEEYKLLDEVLKMNNDRRKYFA